MCNERPSRAWGKARGGERGYPNYNKQAKRHRLWVGSLANQPSHHHTHHKPFWLTHSPTKSTKNPSNLPMEILEICVIIWKPPNCNNCCGFHRDSSGSIEIEITQIFARMPKNRYNQSRSYDDLHMKAFLRDLRCDVTRSSHDIASSSWGKFLWSKPQQQHQQQQLIYIL